MVTKFTPAQSFLFSNPLALADDSSDMPLDIQHDFSDYAPPIIDQDDFFSQFNATLLHSPDTGSQFDALPEQSIDTMSSFFGLYNRLGIDDKMVAEFQKSLGQTGTVSDKDAKQALSLAKILSDPENSAVVLKDFFDDIEKAVHTYPLASRLLDVEDTIDQHNVKLDDDVTSGDMYHLINGFDHKIAPKHPDYKATSAVINKAMEFLKQQ